MISRLHLFINRIANPRALAFLLLLTVSLIAAVNLLDFTLSIPRLRKLSGGAGILDIEVFYTAQKAYAMIASYGDEGRRLYLQVIVSIDLLLPALFSSTLAVAITLSFRQVFASTSWIQKLNTLPLLVWLADYLENAAIATLLIQYPAYLERTARLAGFLTLFKNLLIWSSLSLALFGLARVVWLRYGRREYRSSLKKG